MRTPALYALLLFITGILIGVYADIHAFILFITLAAAIAGAVIAIVLGRSGIAMLLLMPAIVVAGTFLTQLQTRDFPGDHISNFTDLEHELVVIGTVSDEPDIRPNKTFLRVRVDSLGNGNRFIAASGQLRLRIAEATNRFNYRDRIKFESWINRAYGARNPGAFDYKRYLEIRQIHALAYVGSAREVTLLQTGAGDPFIRQIVAPIRDYISGVFDSTMEPHQAALLKGFLLGDVRFIPDGVYQRFKDTGTLHVLAASGANVGYVVIMLLLLGKLAGIHRRTVYGLAIVGVIIFSFLAFNQPSVVRAAVMAVIILFGKLLRRDANWINTISLAGLVILAFRPLYLFDLGTQLSFAAAFSLILFLPVAEPLLPEARGRFSSILRYFLIIFWSTLAAQAGVVPILLYHFQTIPLVSFAANLFVVPLVGFAAMLGIGLVVFSGVPFVGGFLGRVTGSSIDLVLGSIDYFKSWHIPPIQIGAPEVLTVLLYYLVLQLVYLFCKRSRLIGVVAICLVVLANVSVWKEVFAGDINSRYLTILDTWQTPTIVVENGAGGRTLINGGGSLRSFDRGESVVLPYLRHRGIRALDKILVTDTSTANLISVRTVVEGLHELPASGNPRSDSLPLPGADQITPFCKLKIAGTGLALLLGNGAVQSLGSKVQKCDILIIGWQFADTTQLQRLVPMFQPETIIVATYPSRYAKPSLLGDLRARFPGVAIHSTRDEGAITVRISEDSYHVLAMSNG